MTVHSTSLNSATLNITSAPVSLTDTEAKSIQNQITGKQQSLNRLSSDSEMSAEEKAKERQEIQKQIAELDRKLRMLRMEKKEEAKESGKEQEQKAALKDERMEEVSQDDSAERMKEQQEKPNMLPQNIQKMLEAGTLLQKERIQQTTDQKKELTEDILETLQERSMLVPAKRRFYMLFSKCGFSKNCMDVARQKEVILVDFNAMNEEDVLSY